MRVKFFGPHPGIGGAAIPLPRKIKGLIDALDGVELDLDEAIVFIRATIFRHSIQAEVKVCDENVGQLGHGALMLWMPGRYSPPPKHLWRLISFRVL